MYIPMTVPMTFNDLNPSELGASGAGSSGAEPPASRSAQPPNTADDAPSARAAKQRWEEATGGASDGDDGAEG